MVHILFPEVSSVSRYNSSDNELRRLLSEDSKSNIGDGLYLI